ncbi:putative ribonuclease H protein [Cardamine amara subsp. amara]|uniref:Ribonuclease H protein n=1 Tax=Cardamine amara subsp. amara TaxID=228776 RepID=A0ABD1BR10_CARAN
MKLKEEGGTFLVFTMMEDVVNTLDYQNSLIKRSQKCFNTLWIRLRKKHKVWNKKFLSHGGKEVLLKSVALAMPVYSMNLFKLPKEICEEINGVLAKFWWSGNGDKKKKVCTGLLGIGYVCQSGKVV